MLSHYVCFHARDGRKQTTERGSFVAFTLIRLQTHDLNSITSYLFNHSSSSVARVLFFRFRVIVTDSDQSLTQSCVTKSVSS